MPTTPPILRRRLLAAAALAVLGACWTPVARAGNCNPLPGQTGITATYMPNPGGDYVLLQWSADPDGTSITYRVFGAYRLERRDDTAGGPFAAFSRVEGSGNVNVIVARDCVDGPQVATCPTTGQTTYAEPGHTYTYRVVTEYQFSPILCGAEADGLTHDSISNEVQVAVPDPPSGAPKNVVAVADVKKPRVTVTWDRPDVAPPKGATYSVRRRVVTAAPAKDDAALDEIVKLSADHLSVLKFLDKSVLPDTQYEYVVALLLDQQTSESKPDGAFVVGKCPPSKFQIWNGDWSIAADRKFEIETHDALYVTPCAGGGCYGAMQGPLRFGSAPRMVLMDVVDVTQALNTPSASTVAFEMDQADPFSPSAWNSASVTFQKKGKTTGVVQVTRVEDPAHLPATSVCGTIASGKGSGALNNGVAGVGDPVVFAFNAVALGPAPLFAGEVRLDVAIEGGTLDSVADQTLVRQLPNPAIGASASFALAALGPKDARHPQVAGLAVVASASSVPDDGQLRCRVTFVHVGTSETVTAPIASRYAEVRIVPLAETASAPR